MIIYSVKCNKCLENIQDERSWILGEKVAEHVQRCMG